jgi:hypothetical protein
MADATPIPAKQFIQELTDSINEALDSLKTDQARQKFLDTLADNFSGLPYANEANKTRS